MRTLRLIAAAGVTLAVGAFFGARCVHPSRAAAPAPFLTTASALELHVPHARGSVVLDGDMDDPGWLGPSARTNAFVSEDGFTAARPYSDARLVWGDGHLYVALYAADADIRATRTEPDAPVWLDDSFHLLFSDAQADRAFDVSALGTLADGARPARGGGAAGGAFNSAWQSGAHVSHEIDGTPNDPRDDDEEWAIEMAIPLDALGLRGEKGERVGFQVKRCDSPRVGARVCGSWGTDARARGVIVLD